MACKSAWMNMGEGDKYWKQTAKDNWLIMIKPLQLNLREILDDNTNSNYFMRIREASVSLLIVGCNIIIFCHLKESLLLLIKTWNCQILVYWWFLWGHEIREWHKLNIYNSMNFLLTITALKLCAIFVLVVIIL